MEWRHFSVSDSPSSSSAMSKLSVMAPAVRVAREVERAELNVSADQRFTLWRKYLGLHSVHLWGRRRPMGPTTARTSYAAAAQGTIDAVWYSVLRIFTSVHVRLSTRTRTTVSAVPSQHLWSSCGCYASCTVRVSGRSESRASRP